MSLELFVTQMFCFQDVVKKSVLQKSVHAAYRFESELSKKFADIMDLSFE